MYANGEYGQVPGHMAGDKDLRAGNLAEAAQDAAASVKHLYESADHLLVKQAETRPYVLLGAAAGVGFVLGGGMASRLMGMLLAVSGRMIASELVAAAVGSESAHNSGNSGV